MEQIRTGSSLASHYADFLPEKVFDAHTHIYLGQTIPNFLGKGVFTREKATPDSYLRDMLPVMPGVRQIGLNMMPMLDWAQADTTNGLRDTANEYILRFCQEDARHTACPYILPTDTEAFILSLSEKPGVRGFKCYCYGVGHSDVEYLTIGQFLPESLWVAANERKLPIILHLMRPAALSDEDNLSYIMTMTKRYPDAQLVLAHCARGFAAWTAVEGIRRMEERGNIWFDLSAVCEPGPMMACILQNAGKRTVWGSDYPVCLHRGRAISLGEGQTWLNTPEFQHLNRSLVAEENLMAFYQTALLLNLDSTQIQDLFRNNAMELFRPSLIP